MSAEQFVKERYPDAEIDWMKKRPFTSYKTAKCEYWVMHYVNGKHTTLGETKDTQIDAWQSAKDNIVQQEKEKGL